MNEKNKHIDTLENNIKNLEKKSNKAHNQKIEEFKKESKTSDDKVFDLLNKSKK